MDGPGLEGEKFASRMRGTLCQELCPLLLLFDLVFLSTLQEGCLWPSESTVSAAMPEVRPSPTFCPVVPLALRVWALVQDHTHSLIGGEEGGMVASTAGPVSRGSPGAAPTEPTAQSLNLGTRSESASLPDSYSAPSSHRSMPLLDPVPAWLCPPSSSGAVSSPPTPTCSRRSPCRLPSHCPMGRSPHPTRVPAPSSCGTLSNSWS